MSPVPKYDKDGKLPVVESLEEMVSHLALAFENDHINIEYIEDIMKSYKSNPSDWQKFAKFDQFRHTRNLVDQGNGKYNLMLVCWGGGHAAAVHDHSDSHCFMKILQGSLSENRFDWPKGTETMKELSRTILQTNDISYMNDSLGLHGVANASQSETAVSLHLYCPPFDSCKMFDQKTGSSTKCQITFWSKFGERTPNVAATYVMSKSTEAEDK